MNEYRNNRLYKCTYCDYSRNDKYNVRRHENRHRDKEGYKCTQRGCNYRSNNADIMTEHINNHTERYVYVCPYSDCSKRFINQKTLNSHIYAKHKDKIAYIAYDIQGGEISLSE